MFYCKHVIRLSASIVIASTASPLLLMLLVVDVVQAAAVYIRVAWTALALDQQPSIGCQKINPDLPGDFDFEIVSQSSHRSVRQRTPERQCVYSISSSIPTPPYRAGATTLLVHTCWHCYKFHLTERVLFWPPVNL